MPDRPKPPSEDEFTEVFVKGSGPGGQKIVRMPQGKPPITTDRGFKNKTSSAVQLKHLPTGIVVKVQATRSQQQNRKLARQKLADRLEILEKGEKSRTAIVQQSQSKKKSSATKKSRRKYRALDEAKNKAAGDAQDIGHEAGENQGVNPGSSL